MAGPPHLDVLVVPYKPIVGLIPPMAEGEGEATWPATSVSLISGKHDAVLIDAVLTPEDAGQVVDWIRVTGKNFTTIYITHGHGDHFFGLNTILDAFLNARAVTAARGVRRGVPAPPHTAPVRRGSGPASACESARRACPGRLSVRRAARVGRSPERRRRMCQSL
jgi:glyoxylase-like metal-dependent hydrolase (beta-lactamase superfamily II)